MRGLKTIDYKRRIALSLYEAHHRNLGCPLLAVRDRCSPTSAMRVYALVNNASQILIDWLARGQGYMLFALWGLEFVIQIFNSC